MSSKKKSVSKSEQAAETKNAGVIAKVSTVKVEGVLEEIAKSTVKVNQLFADAGAQVTNQLAELQRVGEAIQLKNKELEETYGKEAVLAELDALRIERDTKREEYRLDVEDAKVDAERELADLKTQRDREQAQYIYDRDQRRKENQDAFNEAVRVRNLKETERSEQLMKSWSEREAVLAAKEAEYKAALDKLATFDDTVKAEVAAEVAKISGAIKSGYEHKAQIADIQNNAQIQVLQKDLQMTGATVLELREQLASVKVELRDSQKSLADLAAKSVDGAAQAKGHADAVNLLTNIGSNNGARSKSS